MTAAIIGTGGIGSVIARQLASGCKTLWLSSADQSARTPTAQTGRAAVAAADNRDALPGADAVVLALRFTALKGVINQLADSLTGKLGSPEIIAALLIAIRPLWPQISVLGSAMGVLLFLSTLSFLFTTPGATAASAGGFPVLSVLPGQFLLKDLVLVGASLWTLGDSLGAASHSLARRAGERR